MQKIEVQDQIMPRRKAKGSFSTWAAGRESNKAQTGEGGTGLQF